MLYSKKRFKKWQIKIIGTKVDIMCDLEALLEGLLAKDVLSKAEIKEVFRVSCMTEEELTEEIKKKSDDLIKELEKGVKHEKSGTRKRATKTKKDN